MFEKLRIKFLKNRIKVLLQVYNIDDRTSILDLGGYDGRYMDELKRQFANIKVTIADQDRQGLALAQEKGYNTIFLDGSEKLPFTDKQFDLIFCNSVIEHVTIPKNQIWETKNSAEFKKRSWDIQLHFAKEVERSGKAYFVQTPNRNFFIEHHSWFPFVQFLPRNTLIKFLKFSNKFWIKQTGPDWNLLDENQLKELFPSAKIIK